MRRRLTWAGDVPRLVITVVGEDDVYRVARQLEHGAQGPAQRLGARILHAIDEHRGAGRVWALTRRLGPASALREEAHRRRRRQVQLRLGMPEPELRVLEERVL
jgi:hypothetical protein